MLLDFHKHRKQMVEEKERNFLSKWVLRKCDSISIIFTLRKLRFFSRSWENLKYYFLKWMKYFFSLIFHGYLACRLWISSTAKSWRTMGQAPLTQALECSTCTATTLLIVALLIGFFAFRSRSTEESWNKGKCTGKLVKIKLLQNWFLKNVLSCMCIFGSYFWIHFKWKVADLFSLHLCELSN